MTTDSPLETLIMALTRPDCYPHAVDRVERRETHISHVLLAGDYAYKIKKPLNLGFLDFSTLAARAHYCAEELRLNRRLAPSLYLDVVAITGTPEAPRVGGPGDAIEYAVKMRRFDDSALLDRRLAAGELDADTVEAVARQIARFHAEAAVAPANEQWGKPPQVIAPMRENFAQIEAALPASPERERLPALAAWTESAATALHRTLQRRRDQGRIRECHGDMHLANMFWTGEAVTIFDGIEFNADLRWIDVASEIAFLVMDLDHRGAPALAGRALDAWLAETGDYDAMMVVRLYLVYRAMVRAKINAIRLGQQDDAEAANTTRDDLRALLDLAEACAHAHAPALALTRGVAGTGKTTAAGVLVERIGAIRLRSDVERRRLYTGAPPDIRYGEAANTAVHARLEQLANRVVDAGFPAVVDATFIERARRQPFVELARRRDIPLRILDLRVDADRRDARIAERQRDGRDASEATAAVARAQTAAMDALTDEESACTLVVDNTGDGPVVPPTGLSHGRGFPADTPDGGGAQ